MPRSIIYIVILLFPVLLFSQEKKYFSFDFNWEVPATQALQKYSCECYVDAEGKFEGPFVCFDVKTDSVVKRYNFVDNKLHGAAVEFYYDGSPKLEAMYNNGLPIEEWKEWDEFGSLEIHRVFDESSRLIQDYFTEETPYKTAMGFSKRKEEMPVYTSECILTRIEEEKYKCSEKALNQYYANPPIPPYWANSSNAAITKLKYLLSDRGDVIEVEILESSGDSFIDELAEIHVLNMVPFESAKQYGTPINYWMNAAILFQAAPEE